MYSSELLSTKGMDLLDRAQKRAKKMIKEPEYLLIREDSESLKKKGLKGLMYSNTCRENAEKMEL